MKRLLLILLLMLLPLAALTETPRESGKTEQSLPPPEVQVMLETRYSAARSYDYLAFTLPDGRPAGIVLTEGGSVDGFICTDGQWRSMLMTSVMDSMRPAHLARAAGDDLTFHFLNANGTARMTYRHDGEGFVLVGWDLPGYPPVAVDGDVLTYGEGAEAAEIFLPGGVTSWPWSTDELPMTPEEARARAAITEPNVRDLFPGYTLRDHYIAGHGDTANAVYTCIDGGVLHIRRVLLSTDAAPHITDCMPVRLSESLLSRLEAEPFDDLIWCWLGGDTFRTEDAFDRAAYPLPEGAVILQNRIEKDSLIVLAEAEGVTRLYVFEDGAAPVRITQPLPEGTYLDFFHAGDGDVQFEWNQQGMAASFTRRADGAWRLSWCSDYDASPEIHFSANAFGILVRDLGGEDLYRVGSMDSADLFTGRLDDLTGGLPALDQSGWAVVNNPNPADRLHLRTGPDRSARSLGKFYNGTPLQVLARQGDWTQVQLGFGPTALTGWMMTKYLTFSVGMDAVKAAYPDLTLREEHKEAADELGYGYMVVGVEESGHPDQYILLSEDGLVMYVPQIWLWEGNG